MKKFSIFLSVIIAVLMLFGITVSASGDAAIVQTTVYPDKVSAYVNVENIGECKVQIGTEMCEVISCRPVSETETSTLILVDTSGSVPKEVRAKISELLGALIEVKSDNESFAVAEFGTEITWLCDYTTDRYDLSKSIEALAFDEEYTYLYSVLSNELSSFPTDKFGRIILISDGIENSKNGITYDEFILKVKDSQHMIYTVGFENSNQESLKKLFSFSRQTNAASFTLDEASDVNEICSAINADRNYTCITAEIPAELADGSEKYLRITGENFECGTDIRTIQTEANTKTLPVISETKPETVTEETVPVSEQEASAENEKSGLNLLVIIIPFAAVILICMAVIVVLASKNKNKNNFVSESNDEDEMRNPKENKEAQHKELNRGHTKMLFDISENSNCSETDDTVIETAVESDGNVLVIKLTDIDKPTKVYRYAVKNGIVIGRNSSESMIAVNDKYVSRKHCRIYENGGKAYVENLSAQNHTYVNKKAVNNSVLENGDIISIGKTSFRVEYVK